MKNEISASVNDYFKQNKEVTDDEKSTESSKTANHFYNTSKGVIFKLPKQLKPDQKTILQTSLLKALKVKDLEFYDDLCYPDPECPEHLNNSLFEPGVISLTELNKELYYKFKERTRNGEYAAVEIIEDEIQVIIFNIGIRS